MFCQICWYFARSANILPDLLMFCHICYVHPACHAYTSPATHTPHPPRVRPVRHAKAARMAHESFLISFGTWTKARERSKQQERRSTATRAIVMGERGSRGGRDGTNLFHGQCAVGCPRIFGCKMILHASVAPCTQFCVRGGSSGGYFGVFWGFFFDHFG